MRVKIDATRALNDERLKEEEFSTRLEIMNLKFKISTRQMSNSSELRNARRRLAHILTAVRERELLGGVE